LSEEQIPWLAGYENSKPVRIGNAASNQFQLDVYGEVLAAMYVAHRAGIETSETEWHLQIQLMRFLETKWRDPDEGIWEGRGPRRHFTHSKVMAWVALDRAVKAIEKFDLDGPVKEWRRVRDEIHDDVCAKGYDADRNTFTQFYGSRGLDAALLLLPRVGFLPWDDPRVVGTVDAIAEHLDDHGFVRRYDGDDGLLEVTWDEHLQALVGGKMNCRHVLLNPIEILVK
jgi:GH15 family glucan-1,4-alpha-glucosidase